MAWEAVADLDQLEEGDMMLVQLGEPVCVVRLQEDEVVAVHNTCTHQQQPLNEGYLQDDDTLICPAHNDAAIPHKPHH
jgi:3-phenylpropionate/trans-cinnamate dioxygenase ferredoxin subunit